jgi:hypothetical protein
LADLVAVTIPNLVQGISQQPDGQRDPSQGEIQVNAVSSVAEGLRKRDGSRVLAKLSDAPFGDAFIHSILRDEKEEYLAVVTKTGIRVFDLAGVEKTVNAPGGYGYLSSVTSARDQIRAVSIADYTFILNTSVKPAMDAALTPTTPRPAAHEALVWIKAANYGQTYKVTLNGTTATLQTATAAVIPASTAGGAPIEVKISTEEIAEQLKGGLASVAGVTITRFGSVLHFTSSNPMTIAASDARANSDITCITSTVQAFTELPRIAPKGYLIEIEGDPGNKWDGYFVQFKPRPGAGDFGEGSWIETVAPGSEYKLNASTMPHVLVRLPDGTFRYGPLDGTTVGTVKLPKWGERTAGDYETAPDPSFVGQKINDIFVFRNRLGVLADESVILSRPGEFFNFFPETVTTTLDSDPIDLRASNNRVSVLRYAVPMQDQLVIFSAQYQFLLSSGDSPLTAGLARITVLTSYEVDTRVRPQQLGTGIIFAQANGQWSRFQDYRIRGAGTAAIGVADDISAHVSSYIPAGVYKLAVNDIGGSLYAITSEKGSLNRIYTYKTLVRNSSGGEQRAQSSWSHWLFAGADEVFQVLCVRETLYCLVRYGQKVYLEMISAQDRLNDADATSYPLLLDRVVTTTSHTPAAVRMARGVYDPITSKTTFTLPYTATALTQLWVPFHMGDAEHFSAGYLLAEVSSGTTAVARGDWSKVDVVAGEPFEFRYRFSRFKYMKEAGSGKAAVNTARTQVRSAKLRYHETGYFQVHVQPEHRDEGVYTFDGTVAAVHSSRIGAPGPSTANAARYYEGVFSIPVMSRGEQCFVEIRNNTPHPCKFSTCEWVATISTRARAVG